MITKHIGQHYHNFHFGGNSTGVNLKDTLADVSWREAVAVLPGFNSIATLVFHINYYIHAVIPVFEGKPLDAHDKFSFDCPPIESEADWQAMLARVWSDAERLVVLIENTDDAILEQTFEKEKYGNYFKNLTGILEHSHYHLGQITLIKKLIRDRQSPSIN